MARLIVIMGVSGSGKSTLAAALAEQTGWCCLEADDFHPSENIRKMAAGEPLTNDDRRSWIRSMRAAIDALSDHTVIATCSALNHTVRGWLTEGLDREVSWCWLKLDEDTACERVRFRSGHYMPAALVRSQFEALEPPAEAWQLDATRPLAHNLEELNHRLSAPVAV
ncbi:gluconokinase, GntK/IdnK-type [Maricaulis sp.]|uniref:gluconokinase n=1 Tax=unclassified Maricaulis TaxID=2632371 RepID=UPI001B0DF27F|nr:gluconokinase, GntK/IdnK-type [Maricaulis sp.]MBO6795908.1 AAA family ATPase [Maricaulis sp.]